MNALIHAHSGLRWILLILVLLAIIKGFGGISGNKPFSAGTKKTALFAMITCHLQLLVGLVLLFTSSKVSFEFEGSKVASFLVMEHLTGMILGIALITVGYSTSKRSQDDKKKHKRIAIWYTIGLLAILGSIPWPFIERLQNGGFGWF
ncbi:MAG: hypothetical protein P8M05_07490 [Flavobacteriales bacterium]|nr:hypothetical protein [Flavobacteriales bacterium]